MPATHASDASAPTQPARWLAARHLSTALADLVLMGTTGHHHHLCRYAFELNSMAVEFVHSTVRRHTCALTCCCFKERCTSHTPPCRDLGVVCLVPTRPPAVAELRPPSTRCCRTRARRPRPRGPPPPPLRRPHRRLRRLRALTPARVTITMITTITMM